MNHKSASSQSAANNLTANNLTANTHSCPNVRDRRT
jgi:hypothetical protein